MTLGLAFALASQACGSDDERKGAHGAAAARPTNVPPSVVAPATRPYRERADLATAGGTLRVVAVLDGDAPRDTTIALPEALRRACGPSIRHERVERSGDRIADVVVWLPDVREGKPMPLERRYDLTMERCRLQPRAQVAVAGGTLNLRTVDDLAHRTRFVRYGDGVLTELHTTEPESVIPDERVLDKPGQVEVSCAEHPWARAWLFAFDHPYAAVTTRDGSALLAGVPAGRWRVVAWHEELGLSEGTIDVVPGREAELRVAFKAR
jgi:hypothetical protein